MHDEARAHDATPGRGGAAQGTASAGVFGRAIAMFDAAFYNRARAELSKVAELTVPPREAKAFQVPAGHFFRIVSVEGPQVGDLNLWNAHDLTERFYRGKTRALHATHLSTGDRLWSSFPKLRPMATIIMTPSTGMGGRRMALGCTTSSARDATPTPTCC